MRSGRSIGSEEFVIVCAARETTQIVHADIDMPNIAVESGLGRVGREPISPNDTPHALAAIEAESALGLIGSEGAADEIHSWTVLPQLIPSSGGRRLCRQPGPRRIVSGIDECLEILGRLDEALVKERLCPSDDRIAHPGEGVLPLP